jgi:peptidoglycan hydrolase-like protein with peptidoglycan-binding domain
MEVDTPVFTGSIRRAAREPLAQGGDERLQKLQRALIAAGYGPLKADGRWDERSVSAVRRYEADHGWTVTGKPSDKLVWDLMGKVAKTAR